MASLDIVFESERLPHCDEESVSFERECHSVSNENIKNVKKIKAASTDVAELEEELPGMAAEMPECVCPFQIKVSLSNTKVFRAMSD